MTGGGEGAGGRGGGGARVKKKNNKKKNHQSTTPKRTAKQHKKLYIQQTSSFNFNEPSLGDQASRKNHNILLSTHRNAQCQSQPGPRGRAGSGSAEAFPSNPGAGLPREAPAGPSVPRGRREHRRDSPRPLGGTRRAQGPVPARPPWGLGGGTETAANIGGSARL